MFDPRCRHRTAKGRSCRRRNKNGYACHVHQRDAFIGTTLCLLKLFESHNVPFGLYPKIYNRCELNVLQQKIILAQKKTYPSWWYDL